MAKKAARNLVIVESPAKAKTIGKYLGPDYEVRASMGHLRDLPKSKLGVDVEHDFEPNYRPIRGKEELINELKKLSKASDTVYLATDPDREGEAISWHLKNLLDLSDEKAKRVTFNEITRKVVTESIHHPREIDQDLVDAQQARRILDRIVGYELSPLLWKKIRRGLSAGRVQSVAMRLVADREKEIKDFVPQEYWTLDALLKNDGGVPFRARYYGKDGKKYEPVSQEEVSAIQAEVQALPFAVKSVKRTDKQRSPAPPFTTSTMQQDASRKLNMTPRRTMAIAQQLYEGVDITGEGTVGLITYMRTDSLRISDEAQAAARSFVTGRYGAGYCPAAPRQYKTKAGAVCSPMISCIYMHYVLVWWYKEIIVPKLKGYSGLVVYADDFVVCFQYKEDAVMFYELLKRRMRHFGLSLQEDKSRLIQFGRFAKENCERNGHKPETFTFLGFTHYCSCNKNGKFRVKRKTSRIKFNKKCKEVRQKIRSMRANKLKDIISKLNQILVGYYHYYGITDNGRSLSAFRYQVIRSLHYWLNRRSQKKSYTWSGFLEMIDTAYPLARPKIYVSIYG